MNRVLVVIAALLVCNLGVGAEAQAMMLGLSGTFSCQAREGKGAGCGTAIPAQYKSVGGQQRSNSGAIIPPSTALQAALGYAPGSQGLGVRLLPGSRLVYAVKLKSGNRIRRVLVDARTGKVLGE